MYLYYIFSHAYKQNDMTTNFGECEERREKRVLT
jgi:hypothetical protein